MLLGLDIGSSALKAAAYELRRARLIAHVSVALPLRTDATGRREQAADDLLGALTAALAELRRRCGRRWSSLQGIGLAAQGGSTLVVDRTSGRPRSPLILWNDTRAFGHFHQLAAEFPPRWWRAFSLRDEPAMGLARACWLRERAPRLFAGDPLLAGMGDYVYFLLTGEWRQDPCHALQSGCYQARNGRFTNQAIQRLGLSATLFAPLRDGHATHPVSRDAAVRFALPPSIPVAGPYNDHEAGFASLLHASARPLAASLGTAWVGSFSLPTPARSPLQLCVPNPRGAGYQVIQPLLTGNVTLEWAEATLLDSAPAARGAAITAKHLLPPPGLTALPWLNRPNPLQPATIGGAGFFGANPATTRADFHRALLAGMAFEFARVFSPVRDARLIDALVLCGGRAASPGVAPLFASLWTPLPVLAVPQPAYMGTRGTLFAFDREVARAPCEPVAARPRPDARALREARDLYLATFSRLCGHVPAGVACQPPSPRGPHPS